MGSNKTRRGGGPTTSNEFSHQSKRNSRLGPRTTSKTKGRKKGDVLTTKHRRGRGYQIRGETGGGGFQKKVVEGLCWWHVGGPTRKKFVQKGRNQKGRRESPGSSKLQKFSCGRSQAVLPGGRESVGRPGKKFTKGKRWVKIDKTKSTVENYGTGNEVRKEPKGLG